MTDRVHPSSKPAAANGTTPTATPSGTPSSAANKARLYNPTRQPYRPQPPRRRRSRSCCCCWTILSIILFLILITAIASTVLWLIYRPQRPAFSLSSLQISQFNLTTSSQLSSRFNLTVTARNPNKELVFLYEPITVSVTVDGVDVGNGSFSGFVHGKKNTTTLRTPMIRSGQSMDSKSVGILKSDMKKSLELKVQLDTKVRVKVGSLKTMRVGLRVSCDDIRAAVPTGKSATTATTSDDKCEVDFRIKIWKWTI
ncbi:NDR1/HIN1-like protein 10 [Cornus florida]|uniref:NDR1/HIN1-like protein 10 n=1 Tax=Cornus florida TaxID=4283 RepID=UPI00289EF4AF|nr:NDR1/HIN1-like protein 10 [Cornus florida]